MAGYENRIVVFSEKTLEEVHFKQHLRRICKEYPRCSGVAKRYVASTLKVE
jgi:hypothetical protein